MIYLVLLTLFLCGVVIGLYSVQQENTSSSLVSPVEILRLRDNLDKFELEEFLLIKKSLDESLDKNNFGSPEFIKEFRNNFLDNFISENLTLFLFSNLTWDGREMEETVGEDVGGFLGNILYFEDGTYYKDENLVFSRGEIGKRFILVADKSTEINFPIDFSFNFEKRYLISLDNGKFILEELR